MKITQKMVEKEMARRRKIDNEIESQIHNGCEIEMLINVVVCLGVTLLSATGIMA